MKRLIIADIHANLPAFEAILEDVGDFDEVLFLGDLVMCGPNPAECIDLLQSLKTIGIIGNHDLEVLDMKDSPVLDIFQSWASWTLSQLSSKHLDYLQSLPETAVVNIAGKKAKMIHALTYDKYLLPSIEDEELFRYMENCSEEIILCGHTHRLIDRTIKGKRFISVNAVGQPKDSNCQAGYTIESDGVFEHKRVDYDIAKYIDDVQKIAFPKPYIKRWINFIKTGYDPEWTE